MHVVRERGTVVLRRRGQQARPRRSHHAGKADLADASWRPPGRTPDLPAGLFAPGRYRPDRYLDFRGNGRSEDGPRQGWNLAQMGRCTSGRSARQSASSIRSCSGRLVRWHGSRSGLRHAPHPAHPSRLILDQHRSRRRLLSGAAGRTIRTLRRTGGSAHWPDGVSEATAIRNQARLRRGIRLAMPHYTRVPRDPDVARRARQST